MGLKYPRIQPLSLARARELVANPDRARVLKHMASAATRDQIDAAWSLQRSWLVDNPDDFGVLEAGERLAYAEEALADRPAVTPVTDS
jgi:hypothetical protein